jgi:prepilin-type processing-associated H-X9-DG protein
MKNKPSGNVNYIPAKNVRRSGNCIIHRWISTLLAGICTATGGAAVLWADGSAVQPKGVLLTEGFY